METLLNDSDIEVKRLETITDIVTVWPFLVEGLDKLNTLLKHPHHVKSEEYLRMVLNVVDRGKSEGVVGVAYRGNVPAAYGIVFNNTVEYKQKSAVVYFVYNTKDKDAVIVLLDAAKQWARQFGYKELQAFSTRFTGTIFKLFEHRYGFHRQLVMFSMDL